MDIVLAKNAGFCFGVKRAVEEAIKAQKNHNKKIYTLGPLIHNNDAVSYLKENYIYPIEFKEVGKLEKGDVIIIRSHGIGIEEEQYLHDKELIVIDATCPYVRNIQLKAKKYYENGYNIVIVGDSNHPEVIGINGWCNKTAIITKDGKELKDSKVPNKVCILCQTTEKQINWESTLNEIGKISKEIMAFNTICSATEQRQKEVEVISKEVDMMVVIGGKNSSNTTKLYQICKGNCDNTIHIENVGELSRDIKNNNIKKIGVTAGASTPDWIIKEVINKMSGDREDMNQLFVDYMNENDKQISVGEVTKGEIISLNEKEAYLNIGYKSDAILPLNEVTKKDDVKMNSLFKLGDNVEAKVISRRNEDGYVVLSRIELEREESFKELRKAYEEGNNIVVQIKDTVKGGLVSNYKGVRVFIPASHVELFHIEDLSIYENKELEVKLIEFDESKKSTRIVASRREILKKSKDIEEEGTWKSLEEGTIVEGEVKRFSQFGAFVEIGGVDGLLHISEISWGRVEKPSDVLKIGDKIKVYILSINKENKKLSLSLKKLSENPWENVDVKYPVGNVVLGKVARFASFGAFIELEPGVDGLVHISEISRKRIEKPENALKIGEIVKAKIIDVNKSERKIGLSIKEVDEIV